MTGKVAALRANVPAVAALAVAAIPFAVGLPHAQAQPPPPAYTYEVVSIHKSDPAAGSVYLGEDGPHGGLRAVNTSLLLLVAFAYNVAKYQILNVPDWVSAERFDVTFTPNEQETTADPTDPIKAGEGRFSRNQQRLQAVLRDRFGLMMRTQMRELPIYLLTQAKNGHKLSPHRETAPGPSIQTNGDREITATDATLDMLAGQLSIQLRRPVHNDTHIEGRYDFRLDWVPDPDLPEGSIFSAITDQLGLRLESAKGPVPVYLVEKIQQPAEN